MTVIKRERVTSRANCSSANIGSGFDVAGICFNNFYDEMTLSVEYDQDIPVKIVHDNRDIEVNKNTAGSVINEIRSLYNIKEKVKVSLIKGIPIGRGLGSSAASAAAAAVAMNEMFGIGMSKTELAFLSGNAEVVSSGSPHWDNASASVFGNCTFNTSIDPFKVSNFKVSSKLFFGIIMPEIIIYRKTFTARSMLPESIPLKTAISMSRNITALMESLKNGDMKILAQVMKKAIVDNYRIKMFPYLDELRRIFNSDVNIGWSLSGAGPSILIASNSRDELLSGMERASDIFRDLSIPLSKREMQIGDGAGIVNVG
ncbi:MAG: homoserine kinase [Candidatus Thermoplasmatota archaeon]|jgi:homoserine kinase|nr:homoserine kinase [Candidatus Thermoplasmatota archaeon]